MDKQTAIQYANAFAFVLRREITGPCGDAFELTKKIKTKDDGFAFLFTSETYGFDFKLYCNADNTLRMLMLNKDGSIKIEKQGSVKFGAGADVRNVWF